MRLPEIRWSTGLATALAGALVAIVLGLLTVGVQATAGPRGVPLALAVPDGPARAAVAPIAAQLSGQAGDAVAWQVVDPARAADLLDRAEVYGVLRIEPGAGGALTLTTVTSGAVNPSGTAAAEQVLARASGAIGQAVAQRTGTSPTVAAETVHPAPLGGRVLPLAATTLLWIAGLVANAALAVVALRAGREYPRFAALTAAGAVAVAGPLVVWGFAALWGVDIAWTAGAVGFLVLVAGAFALLQGAVLRLLGLPGIGLLALLYLAAPAVAGQVPELLHPAYRVLLWSWTPLRFSTEGLRSVLLGSGAAPVVTLGVWVFAALAVAGLAVLLWPARRRAAGPVAAREPVPVG